MSAAVFVWLYLRPPAIVWSWPLIGGTLTYVGAQSLFVTSTTLTSAANAIFLQYTAPIYVAVFGVWYLRERPPSHCVTPAYAATAAGR